MASTITAMILVLCVCTVSGASLYKQDVLGKTRRGIANGKLQPSIRDIRRFHNLKRRSANLPTFESEEVGLDFQEHGHPVMKTSNLYKVFKNSSDELVFVEIMQHIYEYGTDHWRKLRDVIYDDLRKIPNSDARNAGEVIKETLNVRQFYEEIIHLYTEENSFYRNVNTALRNHRSNSYYGSYALMLNTILLQWPSIQVYRSTTYRGVSLDLTDLTKFRLDTIFTWTSFTSSSMELDVACPFAKTALFIFNNDALSNWSPKQIAVYSEFENEAECLYPVPAIFKITAVEDSSMNDNLCNKAGLKNIYISLQQGYTHNSTSKLSPDGGSVVEGTAHTVAAALLVAQYLLMGTLV